MRNAILFLMMVFAMNTFGQDTINYWYDACLDYKSTSENACPNGIYFVFNNDSLEMSGTIGTNCCGTHLAIVNKFQDTIFISTIDTGMLCTCGCSRCFILKFPASVNDTIVKLNGIVYHTGENISSLKDNELANNYIFPNPVSNNLQIYIYNIDNLTSIQILDVNGRQIRNMSLIGTQNLVNIDLSREKAGSYFVLFRLKSNEVITKKFIKD